MIAVLDSAYHVLLLCSTYLRYFLTYYRQLLLLFYFFFLIITEYPNTRTKTSLKIKYISNVLQLSFEIHLISIRFECINKLIVISITKMAGQYGNKDNMRYSSI
jgi:hypothetical protein